MNQTTTTTEKKSLKKLAEFVKEMERELAPGSETSLLTPFVAEYDHISEILDAEEDVMIDAEDYNAWVDSYNNLEKEG